MLSEGEIQFDDQSIFNDLLKGAANWFPLVFVYLLSRLVQWAAGWLQRRRAEYLLRWSGWLGHARYGIGGKEEQ